MISNLLSSMSKIVFLLITVTACIGFLFLNRLEAKDFMVLAISAFSFYFASKPSDPTAVTGIK